MKSRNRLAADLEELRFKMLSSANNLRYFGGFNKEYLKHADELDGAAKIVESWIRGVGKRRKK